MSQSDKEASRRPGMPEPGSVITEERCTPAPRSTENLSASAGETTTYRILRTSETNPYDDSLQQAELATLEERLTELGDAYQGTARKAAKLSIADAQVEAFADIKDLIETLPAEKDMTSHQHQPPITEDAVSGRVAEENRNVRVRAFIYAASREADNDFHLIVGHATDSEQMYMTMELSGLPQQDSEYFSRLKVPRDAYKEFCKDHLPRPKFYDFYVPPIPVEIEGSLFFDITHSHGGRPGPNSLRPHMPTIWEVHPITNILFEP
jgi:hypothetical protein